MLVLLQLYCALHLSPHDWVVHAFMLLFFICLEHLLLLYQLLLLA
jgi:hypothetical protein